MGATTVENVVKTVGANGQISLGKEFAGRQVMVEVREPGVWLIREAVVIPANELSLHTTEARASLEKAMEWAANNPAQETDLATFAAKLEQGAAHGSKKATAKRKA